MSEPAPPRGGILIVDDEPGNVLVLEHLLELAGYQNVHSTTDPTEVQGLYRARRPDLILLDLHMPVLDGFAVMRGLAESSEAGDTPPILVLTADATTASRQAALRAGASDFVTKPFEHKDVLARVAALLDAPSVRPQQ